MDHSAASGFWSFTPLLVGLVVVVICVLYSKRWLTQPMRAPQPPKLQWYRSGLPVLGPAIEFRKAPNELLLKAQKELGDVFGLDLVAKQFVFVMGPEAHRSAIPDCSQPQISSSAGVEMSTRVHLTACVPRCGCIECCSGCFINNCTNTARGCSIDCQVLSIISSVLDN
jgi:hypothetical protein